MFGSSPELFLNKSPYNSTLIVRILFIIFSLVNGEKTIRNYSNREKSNFSHIIGNKGERANDETKTRKKQTFHDNTVDKSNRCI